MASAKPFSPHLYRRRAAYVNKPALDRRALAHIQFCRRLRRRLSNKAIAARLKVTTDTVKRYITGTSIPLEDWQERRARR